MSGILQFIKFLSLAFLNMIKCIFTTFYSIYINHRSRTILQNIDPNLIPRLPHKNEKILCRVIDVYDGDTCTILYHLDNKIVSRTSLRLAGIDTPEMKSNTLEGTVATRIRDHVRNKILDKILYVKFKKIDKYGGRIVGDLYLDDNTTLSEYLLQKKYALPFDGNTKKTAWQQSYLQSINDSI